MSLVHLIRHGQRVRGGPRDHPLSPEGRAQAAALAGALESEAIAAVYTSPLRRAAETAAILARPHLLDVVETPLLRERVNWGDLPGQTRADFEQMWLHCDRERTWVPEVGDSSVAAGQRLERFVASLGDLPVDAQVVAVTHGGILADFLLNAFSTDELASTNSAFARQPYSADVVHECSVTRIRAEAGTLRLIQIAAPRA